MSDRVHGCLGGPRERKLGSGFVARVAESGGNEEGWNRAVKGWKGEKGTGGGEGGRSACCLGLAWGR